MGKQRVLVTLGTAFITGGTVSAQSLSSGFTGNTVVPNDAPDTGQMFDLTALHSGGVRINSFDIHSRAAAGTPIMVDVLYKEGSLQGYLTNPGAWTLIGTVPATAAGPQQPTPVSLGGFTIPSGETYGVYINIQTAAAGVRYNNQTQTMAMTNPENEHLRITFVPHGTALWGLFGEYATYTPRAWNGTVYYSTLGCYANCDNSTTPPILNFDDFSCFINQFAGASSLPYAQQVTHYANCDNSTTAPALNVDDFTCFINKFAAGCP